MYVFGFLFLIMPEIFIIICGILFFIYLIKADKRNRKKIDEENRKIHEKYKNL